MKYLMVAQSVGGACRVKKHSKSVLLLSLQNNLLQHSFKHETPMYKHTALLTTLLRDPFLPPCLADLFYQIFQILDLLGQRICLLFQSLVLLF